MSDHLLDNMRPEQITTRRGVRGLTLECQNTVRTYNYAPGIIALQIRSGRQYTTATLTRDQISKLIECLHDCLDSGIV